MKRNSIRVVCNPYTKKMSYYFKNEIGEWTVLSGSSSLSRQYYTNTTIRERAKEIVAKIDEIYNRKNKGVDILFEGTTENYHYLCETIEKFYGNREINCILGTTKIAVLGKKSVGKTMLIEGLEKLGGYNYSKEMNEKYIQYMDECNHAQWYEVNGIDLGIANIEQAFQTIRELSERGLSAVVYCVSAVTGRIEDVEKDLIKRIEDEFSELKVMIVLTMCYKDGVQETIDEIEKITDQVKLVVTLAKAYKTNLKDSEGNPIIIEPFGLEMVSEYVFEGR